VARRVAGWLMLSVNAAYFGSLSVPLWLMGGPMGGICSVMLLSAGAIYAVINAPRSTSVMLMTASIQFLYLAATPVFMAMHGATPGFVTAAAIAVGVFITYCLSTWQRMNDARLAESAARLEAEAKRAQAERIMDGRSAFLAAIAHDLRTPISAILTGAAELERGATDAAARSQAHLITDAGFMMKAMLDDLLDHAKLDAGHMTVDQVDFNLRELLNQTTRLWRGPARAKGLKLRVEGAASIPAAVRGDPMRVRQVLNNLISNAMKFTETGSITLRLTAWSEEPGGHAVLIAVEDTGPGMTADQVARLFTPFRPDHVGHQRASRRHRPRPGHQPSAGGTDGRTGDRAHTPRRRRELHPGPVPAAGRGRRGRAPRAGSGEPRRRRPRPVRPHDQLLHPGSRRAVAEPGVPAGRRRAGCAPGP
jgi:signal transduction histidine kinase